MPFSLKRATPTAFSFITAVGGLLLLACVSTNQSPQDATTFTPVQMTDGERDPASVMEGTAFKSFKTEFAAATALNSYTGILGYNMEKNSKLAVLAKWARMAPQEVRKEIATEPEGFEIGYHRSRVSGHTSEIRVVFKPENVAEISQNMISFVPDIPALDGADNNRDQKVIEQALPQIEGDLQQLVTQIVKDNHYEAMHLGGHATSRVELVSQLGLLVPEAVNSKYLGLSHLNPLKARQWSHAWRDQLDLNFTNDPRVSQSAREALKEVNANRAGLHTPLSGVEILTLVSREQQTSMAIAQAIDVILNNPEALLHAQAAAQQNRTAELDALINEALRLKPTIASQLLFVKDDIVLHSGVTLKKGQSVYLLNSVSNRDRNLTKAAGFSIYAETDPTLRLMQNEVRAAVAAIVAMPGLRRVDGDKGNIERRYMIEQSNTPLVHDDYRYSFPESIAVEWPITSITQETQIATPAYAYEDYLNDYDRDEFRLCTSGQLPADYTNGDLIPAILRGMKTNKANQLKRDNKDLFFCRLEKSFRSCFMKEATEQKFFYLEASDKSRAAYAKCEANSHLTPTEKAFYPTVMLGDDLDEKRLNTAQAQRTSGPAYQYEDYLKFYNRYTARQSLMNPVGMIKFKNQNRDMLFYVRLNLDFRSCIGVPVVTHDTLAKVGIKAYRDLDHQYDFCKNGIWNQSSLRREGALSEEEKFFYETIMLQRKETYKGL